LTLWEVVMLKNLLARAGVVVLAAAPLLSHAQSSGTTTAIDYSGLTSQVDFTTTIAAVMTVAGLVTGLYLAIKGAKVVIGMVRGA